MLAAIAGFALGLAGLLLSLSFMCGIGLFFASPFLTAILLTGEGIAWLCKRYLRSWVSTGIVISALLFGAGVAIGTFPSWPAQTYRYLTRAIILALLVGSIFRIGILLKKADHNVLDKAYCTGLTLLLVCVICAGTQLFFGLLAGHY